MADATNEVLEKFWFICDPKKKRVGGKKDLDLFNCV